MFRHLARNIILMIPTILGITVIIFVAIRMIPGDAVIAQLGEVSWADEARIAQLRREMGLDQPWHVQYLRWIGGLLQGDLGTSFSSGQPVMRNIERRLFVSVELAAISLILGLLIAIPIGVLSALRQNTWADHLGRLISVLGLSVPNFVLATLFILLASIWFRWQPPPGFRPFFESPWVHLQQILPPAIALGAHAAGLLTRMTRSAMLEVLRQDYVRTGRAKGLRERLLVVRHALPNALVPVISVSSTTFAFLLGGVVIVETIFTIPGMGSLTVDALFRRDYPQLMVNVLFLGLGVVIVNVTTDFLYAAIDPRIRLS